MTLSDILTLAIKEGNVDAVRRMADEEEVDLNSPVNQGFTPIEIAVKDNSVPIIKALVELGADDCSLNSSGTAPIHLASYFNNIESIQALGSHTYNTRTRHGATPVFVAAQEGHVVAIRQLAKLGASVHITNFSGETPMFRAARYGTTDAIRALADLGGNVKTPDCHGMSPAHIASQNGHVDALKVLVNLGADVNSVDSRFRSPMFSAAQKGQVVVMGVLAELGANIRTCDRTGATPVHIAAHHGSADSIQALNDLGADVNVFDKKGLSPAHMAAENGHVDAIKVLAELGVDVSSCCDKHGNSALHYAALGGNHVEMIKTLVTLRSDVDMVPVARELNGVYCSPLTIAVNQRNYLSSACLARLGADVTHCLQKCAPSNVLHLREVISDFCERARMICPDVPAMTANVDTDVDADADTNSCSWFSLTQLMTNVAELESEEGAQPSLETDISVSLYREVSGDVVNRTHQTPYVLKRKMIHIAWKLYQLTLLVDGDRVNKATKMKRYVELVCFLCDHTMLEEVMSLRMTCKSNSERRRFPVCHRSYHELEANIMEEFVAFESSRFVPTEVLLAVMRIHNSESFVMKGAVSKSEEASVPPECIVM